MAKKDTGDFHFPIGRWLAWALVAVIALFGLVMFIAWIAHEEDPDAGAEGDPGEQVEWSIVLTDQGGQTVTLKGDLPDGVTTETWVDDNLVARALTGTFEWDMSAELPVPVVTIDQADGCGALNAELDIWVGQIGAADGEALNLQARAFAQHALDEMRAAGCPIDESTLQDAAG